MMPATNIVIVDQERIACRAVRRNLKNDPQLHVVGEACSVREALPCVAAHQPHIVIVADRLSGLRGMTLASVLRREHPTADVIIIAEGEDIETTVAAVEAGAVGLVSHHAPAPEMLKVVSDVAKGKNMLHSRAVADPAIMARLLQDVRSRSGGDMPLNRYDPGVSPRLIGVLDGVVSGWTNREIGEAEGLAEQTVKHHVASLKRRLGVRDRIGLVRHTMMRGWSLLGPEPSMIAPRPLAALEQRHSVPRLIVPGLEDQLAV